MKTLKAQIELSAKEAKCTELEIITAMQSVLASNGDDKNLEILCKLKMDYINF